MFIQGQGKSWGLTTEEQKESTCGEGMALCFNADGFSFIHVSDSSSIIKRMEPHCSQTVLAKKTGGKVFSQTHSCYGAMSA